MAVFSILLALSLTICTLATPPPVIGSPDRIIERQRRTCTPLPRSGFDMSDLNSAIAACSQGGLIIIPANQTYVISAPLDFYGCNNCEIQVEGTLKVSDNLVYWQSHSSVFLITNKQGLRIHSVTGSGVIDGNGAAWYSYVNTYGNDLNVPVLVRTSSSSNISISNLTVKDAPAVFFATEGGSTDINYSSLTISSSGTGSYIALTPSAFTTSNSSAVSISATTASLYGTCVSMQGGSKGISIRNITCNTETGVIVRLPAASTQPNVTVENILVSDAVLNVIYEATGIFDEPSYTISADSQWIDRIKPRISNVTWEDIQLVNTGSPAYIGFCEDQGSSYCMHIRPEVRLEDVVFKDFSGTSHAFNATHPSFTCPSTSTCDVRFEDWSVQQAGPR